MGRIDRLIFIKNAVETLGYFSEQIALGMDQLGFDTYFIDYDDMYQTLDGLSRFAQKGKTALVTFNFIGLSGEDIFLKEDGGYLWEAYGMRYLNILVDHPLYYHAKLMQKLPQMTVFCIDREHVRYMERFYPEVKGKFLPLAGNRLLFSGEADFRGNSGNAEMLHLHRQRRNCAKIPDYEVSQIPYELRSYDLVFTANYVPFDALIQHITKLDAENAAFCREALEDLISHPAQPVDAVIEHHIRSELGGVCANDMRAAMAHMAIIDLCARACFREQILAELANGGVKLHLFGADWESLRENKKLCRKPQNLVIESGQVNSAVCVQAIRDARISLNIMPWFKDGAHDRIFTAMLQKTVALTDDSRYLRENFEDGKELVYFSLEEREKLPEQIDALLSNSKRAREIAENGYRRASAAHTWMERAGVLAEELGSI